VHAGEIVFDAPIAFESVRVTDVRNPVWYRRTLEKIQPGCTGSEDPKTEEIAIQLFRGQYTGNSWSDSNSAPTPTYALLYDMSTYIPIIVGEDPSV
jgi:hypothetical protein